MATAGRATTRPEGALLRLHLGMEGLWLLTAALVPLILVPPDSMIVYHYVPKVALLRTLVGLMTILWVLEWALRGHSSWRTALEHPWTSLTAWLRDQPTRWLLVAATLFLAVNILSTLLSTSFRVSLWGYFPGRDGYALYNVAAYFLLFIIVATHLKTPAQLWRLLGVIVVTGVVAATYGVLQHYDLDPWDVSRAGGSRIESTFGNPIFAAAFLLMTVPISLAVGMVARTKRWASLALLFWVAVVVVQLLAVLFTLSRGPWVGLAVGLVLFLVLAWLTVERRILARGVLILASPLGMALIVALVLSVSSQQEAEEEGSPDTIQVLTQRLASISPEVFGGELSDRLETWKGSARLALDRPWLEFDSLSLSPLRPLIGYGPDLFQAVSHLEIPTEVTGSGQVWFEVNHAHNYPLHEAVELGGLGLLTYVGLVAAIVAAGPVQLLRHRRTYSTSHKLVLVALSASLGGRLVEQTVGVARIGDLPLFWILLAVLVALPSVMAARPPEPARPQRPLSRRRPQVSRRAPGGQVGWRLAIAVPLIVALGALTWVKNVNYVRADIQAASAERSFSQGNLQEGLPRMVRATELAPDVTLYQQRRAEAYHALREATSDATIQRSLAQAAYEANLKAFQVNPLARDVRFDLARSTLVLVQLGESEKSAEAVQHYEELVSVLPQSWAVHYNLAISYLINSEPRKALVRSEKLLALNENLYVDAKAFFVQGGAYLDLGQTDQAITFLEQSLKLPGDSHDAAAAHRVLADLYRDQGDEDRAEEHTRRYQELQPTGDT